MKYAIIISLLCAATIANIYAEGEIKDEPFDSLLPEPTEKPGGGPVSSKVNVAPPQISVEGVLWGNDSPQTIIDGDVYKVGDTLKRVDAKVYKIEKNKVFIFYSGRLFEMGINKKEGK